MRAASDRLPAALAVLAGLLAAPVPAAAHPHVFVDGGVDFVLGRDGRLEALDVTWLFDEFESLYLISSTGHSPDPGGGLDDRSRQVLIHALSDWREDFGGSAHLKIDGDAVVLARPTGVDLRLVEGRLEMTFRRQLAAPVDLADLSAEVGFYEATYFYDFTVTADPRIVGGPAPCESKVIPFEPDKQLKAIQTTLFDLGREETPEIENVGALFADRIAFRCR